MSLLVMFKLDIVIALPGSSVPRWLICPQDTHHRDTVNTENAQRVERLGHYRLFVVTCKYESRQRY